MARIQEYNANVTPSTEIQSQRASASSFGQGLETFGAGLGRGIGDVSEIVMKSELSKAKTLYAKKQLDDVTYIDNMKESFDPTDPEQRDKFLGPIQDTNEKLLNDISNPDVREHMGLQMAQDREVIWKNALKKNAEIQGREFGANAKEQSAIYSQLVYHDPLLLDSKLKEVEQNLVNTPVGAGNEAAREKAYLEIKNKLSFSAAQGEIRQNPETALKKIDSGHYSDLSGEQVNQLVGQAERTIDGRKREAERTQKDAEEKKQKVEKETASAFYGLLFKNELSIDRIEGSTLSDEKKLYFKDRLNKTAKDMQYEETDPVEKAQMFDKIIGGEILDYGDILKANRIGDPDKQQLVNLLIEQDNLPSPALPEVQLKKAALARARSELVRQNQFGNDDRLGSSKYLDFSMQMEEEYQRGIKSGKTPLELLTPGAKGNIVDTLIKQNKPSFKDVMYDLVKQKKASKNGVLGE